MVASFQIAICSISQLATIKGSMRDILNKGYILHIFGRPRHTMIEDVMSIISNRPYMLISSFLAQLPI
jgi:hypothetical protein